MARVPAFMGIDLGTTGIRIMVSDQRGDVICSSSRGVEKSVISSVDQTKQNGCV